MLGLDGRIRIRVDTHGSVVINFWPRIVVLKIRILVRFTFDARAESPHLFYFPQHLIIDSPVVPVLKINFFHFRWEEQHLTPILEYHCVVQAIDCVLGVLH